MARVMVIPAVLHMDLRNIDLYLSFRLGLNLGFSLQSRLVCLLKRGCLAHHAFLQLPPGSPLISTLLAGPTQISGPFPAIGGLCNLFGNFHRLEDVGRNVLFFLSLVDLLLAAAAILLHLQAVEMAKVWLQDYLIVNDPAVARRQQTLAVNGTAVASF